MKIELYPTIGTFSVGVCCAECHQPIGTKACVIITDKADNLIWYCNNCISIWDGRKRVFPCSE